MTERRRLIAVGLVGVTALTGALVLLGVGRHLPVRMTVEELVVDLSTGLDPATIVAEAPTAPVALGALEPSHDSGVHAGRRLAILAPPPARLRWELRVPPSSALRFGVGVEGHGNRDRDASGVRFTVAVDDRQVFARVVNPASRRDRRWFDEQVPLATAGEGPVRVTLATEPAGAGPLAGTPGWSNLRIIRTTAQDRQTASPTAPSVLVLLVDALRADRLGCYGARPSPSPTLDRLAEGALVFSDAIAQASWTMPSVATLFTGLHPRSHGVVGREDDAAAGDGAGATFLPDGVRTLAEHVERAGITTVGVSANPLISRATNYARGFETFIELAWDPRHGRMPGAAEVNAAFLSWLRPNRGLRFLAYLHYMDPHDPYAPPAALRPAPPDGIRPAVAAGDVFALARQIDWHGGPPLPAPEVAHLRALYDAEIRSWDAGLATLLDRLAALGVARSTVVVVTADHGEEFQEHGMLKHGRHLYDESLRVPLVVVGPRIAAGRVAEQAQGIDLFPTVAGLLGTPAPSGLPGQDLLGPRSDRPAVSETRYGATPAGAGAPLLSVRTNGWKLIHAPALGQFELYDLRHDPAEHDNRYGQAPEGAALAALLAGWRAAPAPAVAGGGDPALVEKLRALGYVE